MRSSSWTALRARFRQWTGVRLPHSTAAHSVEVLAEVAAQFKLTPERLLAELDAPGRGHERQRLIDRLAIGTTWFWREPDALERLVAALAPAARTPQSAADAAISVWSVGSSPCSRTWSGSMPEDDHPHVVPDSAAVTSSDSPITLPTSRIAERDR